MGKSSDLFKKITKGGVHAKMGTIKDRNGMDLTEAEDIKKRQQEYTEELCKKELHNPDNHDGVITHLEPDILDVKMFKMLKILQARLQQYMNSEFPDVQAGFRKGRGTRDQIANILWIIKLAREFQKNIYFCFIDYAKAFDCVITINCGKF